MTSVTSYYAVVVCMVVHPFDGNPDVTKIN